MRESYLILDLAGEEYNPTRFTLNDMIDQSVVTENLKLGVFRSLYHSAYDKEIKTWSTENNDQEVFSFNWCRILKSLNGSVVSEGVYGIMCHASDQEDVSKLVYLYNKCVEIDFENKGYSNILLLRVVYCGVEVLMLVDQK